MAIEYAIFDNNITSDLDDCEAMGEINGSADGDDLVPNPVDGTYRLEVRARMDSGTSARELRIGRWASTLTVLPS